MSVDLTNDVEGLKSEESSKQPGGEGSQSQNGAVCLKLEESIKYEVKQEPNDGTDNTSKTKEDVKPKLDPVNASSGPSEGEVKKPMSNKQIRRKAKRSLNCAARKKLKFWINSGKTFDEAFKLCTQRLLTIPDYKLIKNEERRLKKEMIAARKQEEMITGVRLPKLKPGQIKVKVRDTPLVTIANGSGPMTNEQMESVRDEIMKGVDSAVENGGPNFLGCFVMDGNIILTCDNKRAKEWIVQNIEEIKPFDGAKLSIVDNPTFPIADIFLSELDINEVSLIRRLDAQNMGVKFRKWKLLERTVSKQGQHFRFAIDEACQEALKRKNYHLTFNFGKITVKILPTDYLKVLVTNKEGLTGPLGKSTTHYVGAYKTELSAIYPRYQ